MIYYMYKFWFFLLTFSDVLSLVNSVFHTSRLEECEQLMCNVLFFPMTGNQLQKTERSGLVYFIILGLIFDFIRDVLHWIYYIFICEDACVYVCVWTYRRKHCWAHIYQWVFKYILYSSASGFIPNFSEDPRSKNTSDAWICRQFRDWKWTQEMPIDKERDIINQADICQNFKWNI